MTKNTRVLNLSKRCRWDRGQAEDAIEACSYEWVEVGVSVRMLSVEESRLARIHQAAVRERLSVVELRGLWYEDGRQSSATAVEKILARVANHFVCPQKKEEVGQRPRRSSVSSYFVPQEAPES
ncbi:MAG: hypothetical protein WB424_01830 [Terracidiphilus sp.]